MRRIQGSSRSGDVLNCRSGGPLHGTVQGSEVKRRLRSLSYLRMIACIRCDCNMTDRLVRHLIDSCSSPPALSVQVCICKFCLTCNTVMWSSCIAGDSIRKGCRPNEDRKIRHDASGKSAGVEDDASLVADFPVSPSRLLRRSSLRMIASAISRIDLRR